MQGENITCDNHTYHTHTHTHTLHVHTHTPAVTHAVLYGDPVCIGLEEEREEEEEEREVLRKGVDTEEELSMRLEQGGVNR